MSKPTVVTPVAATNTEKPAPAPAAPKEKLPPAKAAAVTVGRMIGRSLAVEGKIGTYSKEIGEGLANARRWLETVKGLCEGLPAGFRPASAKPTNPNIAVGVHVIPRDKRRETYASVLTADELTRGFEVVGIHGSVLQVKLSKGNSFIPKAHLKVAEPAPAAS